MSRKPIPVVVIFAPTASGKTALTRELFSPKGSHFILNAEVVSADSQAVYRGMDIGTAKPEKDLQNEIPHHLIDILTPDLQFNVADFVHLADSACKKIYENKRLPVVCGGSGFYIRSFLFGLPKTPESDERIRNQLKERIAKEGNEALWAELNIVDPESAGKIHVNDGYRICRALEVFYTTGKKRSECKLEGDFRSEYDFLFIVLEPPREVLYDRIGLRVEKMFEAGLADEVSDLIKAGFTKESPGMKAIGYSEFFEGCMDGGDPGKMQKDGTFGADFAFKKEEDGAVVLSSLKKKIKHDSCKYAKKQYTYIKDIPKSCVIRYNNEEKDLQSIADLVRKFAQKHGFPIDVNG